MKKNLFYVLLLVVNHSLFKAAAQNNAKAVNLLEITGAALLNDERVAHYSVSVYLDGEKIDSMFTRSRKTIKFYVSYNKVYTFLYQKKNCADKIIIVNTEVPAGLYSMEDDTFEFEVELSQSLTKKSEDMEDFPVAVLLIDREEQVLQASLEYNKLTHNDPDILTSNDLGIKSNGFSSKK